MGRFFSRIETKSLERNKNVTLGRGLPLLSYNSSAPDTTRKKESDCLLAIEKNSVICIFQGVFSFAYLY